MISFRSIAGAALLALACLASTAHAQDAARPEAMVAFFADQAPSAKIVKLHNRGNGRDFLARSDGHGSVKALIQAQVCAQIGCQWVSTALRIAKIESGFRCNARNGRAVGVFQNTRPEAFGVSRAAAMTCAGGVRAGVAHMRACAAKGARTAAQHMRCHNSGSPWGRVERAYRIAMRG